ncbi:hypothetical protein [Ruegeria sp.]|uniref:hypothetical protein n=1 Tax=Ruegeria sp. TaxID=1879320 RepID=UPI00231976D4|nr:hypothetical protein [Ruegeria sp.]MDA7967136.1 hypothetical protein [Ruegeria sp.]
MTNGKPKLDLQANPTPSDEAGEFSSPDEKADVRAKNHELDVLKAKMGPIGGLIGSTDSSKTIAFMTVLICLIMMTIVFFAAFDGENGNLPEAAFNLLSLLGSIVTGCIGFIFGTKDK